MTTASESVERALRLIGVISEGTDVTADQLQDGVTSLNRMLHSWKLAGVDLTHVDLIDTGSLVLGPEFHDGIEHLLAQVIAAEYGLSFDGELLARTKVYWRHIAAAYIVPNTIVLDDAITEMPSHLIGNALVY